jgi:hypothetical protein
MPLQRLRRILNATHRVRVESSDSLVAKVNREIAARRQRLQAKGAPIPDFKTPTVLAALQGSRDWDIRAIDLLHKIGFLTTPGWLNVNMAKLSASWATRRYFWTIAEPLPTNTAFRLSEDARQMDFHQKTLLSDEFGVGMAGLLMEQFLGAASFIDISVALNAPEAYQNIDREGSAQPDYLMWGEDGNSPYYVVECKGTQSNKSISYDQLRRGLEQVPSVVLGAGPRPVVTLVVATCLLDDRTDVFVLDPPPDEPEDDHPERELTDEVSERTGKRSWQIRNPEAFRERAVITEESNLLKWAGQYQTAAVRDRRLEARQPELMAIPNAPLETKRTDFGDFRGIEQSLFPALGIRNLKIFTGVEEELLELLIQKAQGGDGGAGNVGQNRGLEPLPPQHLPGNISVSRSGTCMIIEGL